MAAMQAVVRTAKISDFVLRGARRKKHSRQEENPAAIATSRATVAV